MSKPVPKAMRQVNLSELEILWDDGHRSVYHVAELRRSCACATCVDEMTGETVLDREAVPDSVRPKEIKSVGRYAIAIDWSDGHHTGIYSFDMLRRLCPCSACQGRR